MLERISSDRYHLRCDAPGCDARSRKGSTIAEALKSAMIAGWQRDDSPDTKRAQWYCAEHPPARTVSKPLGLRALRLQFNRWTRAELNGLVVAHLQQHPGASAPEIALAMGYASHATIVLLPVWKARTKPEVKKPAPPARPAVDIARVRASKEPIKIGDLVDLYLANLDARVAAKDVTRHALLVAQNALTKFKRDFGDLPWTALTSGDLTRWVLDNAHWRSNNTRAKVTANVRTCFLWASNEAEIIDKMPFRQRRAPWRFRPRREFRAVEYVAMMRCRNGRQLASRPLRRVLFFLRRTGARPGEARNLVWDQIDWQNGVAVLAEHKTVRKTGAPRIIGLEPVVLRFLRNLLRQRDPSKPNVFLTCSGKPWTPVWLSNAFRRVADRAGLAKDLVPYSSRHFFITNALVQGMSERQVADQAGTTTKMMNWYGHTQGKIHHLKSIASEAVRRKKG